MLSNDAAVKFLQMKRIAFFPNPGKIIIEYGCSRNLSLSCSAMYKARRSFIDAPVSGSVKPAQDGALVILVGTHTSQL
jgi:3-hydroxyisobutyrate dehydrogenase